MILVDNLGAFPARSRQCVLCIGNFDGVHRGHARMLGEGRRIAAAEGRPFVIMTFDPHPLSILQPALSRPPLMSVEQRIKRLAEFSPDVLLLIGTSREFLAMTAEEFLRNIVCETLAARQLVEGVNFTFGRGARGTVQTLLEFGEALGFKTLVVPTAQTTLCDLALADVSSTLARWLVSHGRVADARRVLGRPYTLCGRVKHAGGRGKILGFPTVNLELRQIIPAHGVYSGRAIFDTQSFPAAISVGTNPTFGGCEASVEAFVLDFSGDLYERTIELELHRWIREQQAYSGPEPLRRRIAADVRLVRELAATHKGYGDL